MPAPAAGTSVTDAMVFALANIWAYLRHPRLALISSLRLRRLVDFARPRTHGEMMQWRKVFDHDPAFATYSDKLAAKAWARSRSPDLKTAEVLWSGQRLADLPEGLLAPGHMLKVNNGSGRNYLPHRDAWPRAVLERRMARWLRPRGRPGEWGYGQVVPRLFVERLIGEGRPVIDLTFRAFDGVVALAFVATDWKTQSARGAYLDADGRRLPLAVEGAGPLEQDFLVPTGTFARARRHAETLSRGTDHMRVDFLIDGEDVYFCEATLYTASGYGDEDRLGLGAMLLGHWLAAIDKSDFLARPRPWPLSVYQAAFRRWKNTRHDVSAGEAARYPENLFPSGLSPK